MGVCPRAVEENMKGFDPAVAPVSPQHSCVERYRSVCGVSDSH